jgi:hypothetical protein
VIGRDATTADALATQFRAVADFETLPPNLRTPSCLHRMAEDVVYTRLPPIRKNGGDWVLCCTHSLAPRSPTLLAS